MPTARRIDRRSPSGSPMAGCTPSSGAASPAPRECAFAAALQVQIERQVEAAERQPLDPRRASDLGQRQQAARALDDRPHRLAGGDHRGHLRGAFHLGQQHADDARLGLAEGQVGGVFGMLRGVHPHQQAHRRLGREERRQVVARLAFERLFDGVLEVDDDAIGATGQGLGETLRATAGHEQGRANGRWVHGLLSCCGGEHGIALSPALSRRERGLFVQDAVSQMTPLSRRRATSSLE